MRSILAIELGTSGGNGACQCAFRIKVPGISAQGSHSVEEMLWHDITSRKNRKIGHISVVMIAARTFDSGKWAILPENKGFTFDGIAGAGTRLLATRSDVWHLDMRLKMFLLATRTISPAPCDDSEAPEAHLARASVGSDPDFTTLSTSFATSSANDAWRVTLTGADCKGSSASLTCTFTPPSSDVHSVKVLIRVTPSSSVLKVEALMLLLVILLPGRRRAFASTSSDGKSVPTSVPKAPDSSGFATTTTSSASATAWDTQHCGHHPGMLAACCLRYENA
mmetsp:Transcript_141572/g.369006  ORF Transcript_141572/g.369006 Transcript_141572/m.369006 type:complete len:280 (-) Transcript_141572:7-846(-)